MLSPRRIAEVTRRARRHRACARSCAGTRACRSVAPERVTPALVAALQVDVEDGLRRAACQPSARADRRGARRLRAHRRRRHRHGQPERAAASGVNDDARDAGSADARLRRDARQALLPAPRRPGAGHGALAHDHRRGPGADARAARRGFRGWRCRPTCSTFPARTARCRSVPRSCRATSAGSYRVEDRGGGVHVYEDVCARTGAHAAP